jgi:hypothetical protein
MSNYTGGDGGGGCFAESTCLTLIPGGPTPIGRVGVGSRVLLATGGRLATVRAVVAFPGTLHARLVRLPGGGGGPAAAALLTPGHPVWAQGRWQRAERIPGALEVPGGEAVYNLVLDGPEGGEGGTSSSHAAVVVVGGWPTLCLGHGVRAAGAWHPFYASRERVLRALEVSAGGALGSSVVRVRGVQRNAQGRACGFL